MINQDTICAVSTAPGAGGVAVIRVSGTDAIFRAKKLTLYATVVSVAGKS